MEDKKDIMQIIADANKSVTTGIDSADIEHWVWIHIMGRAYQVPAGLTIMQAMEYAGYKFITSAGCRAGFCGACATMYRKEGEYKLQTAMACQTRVEDGMFLVQIPFAPAQEATYDITKEPYAASTLLEHYPEIARCVACNTCTKACPQDLEVMDYIQDALRGDYKKVAERSFDCIQCGLCAVRCPAEITQFNVGMLARRMYGRYGMTEPEYAKARLTELDQGKYDKEFKKLLAADVEELKKRYAAREREAD